MSSRKEMNKRVRDQLHRECLEKRSMEVIQEALQKLERYEIPLDIASRMVLKSISFDLVESVYKNDILLLDVDLMQRIVRAIRSEGLNEEEMRVFKKIRTIAKIHLYDDIFDTREKRLLELEIINKYNIPPQKEIMQKEFGIKRASYFNIKSDAYAKLTEIVDTYLTEQDRKALPALRSGLYATPKQVVNKHIKHDKYLLPTGEYI